MTSYSGTPPWITIQKPQKKTRDKLEGVEVKGESYWEWEQKEAEKFGEKGDDVATIKKKIKKKRDYYGKQDLKKEEAKTKKAQLKEGTFIPKVKVKGDQDTLNRGVQTLLDDKREHIKNGTYDGTYNLVMGVYDPRILLCSIQYPKFNRRVQALTYHHTPQAIGDITDSLYGPSNSFTRVREGTDDEQMDVMKNPILDLDQGNILRMYPLPPPLKDDPRTWGLDERGLTGDGQYGYKQDILIRKWKSDISTEAGDLVKKVMEEKAQPWERKGDFQGTQKGRFITSRFKIAFNTGPNPILPHAGKTELTDEQYEELMRDYEMKRDSYYALIPTKKTSAGVNWLGLDDLSKEVSLEGTGKLGKFKLKESARYEEEIKEDPKWSWTIGSSGGVIEAEDKTGFLGQGGSGYLKLNENQTRGIRQLPPIAVHIDMDSGCVFTKSKKGLDYVGALKYTVGYGKTTFQINDVLTHSDFKYDHQNYNHDVFMNDILNLRGHRQVEIDGKSYGVSSGINMMIDHLNYRTHLHSKEYHSKLETHFRKHYIHYGRTIEEKINGMIRFYCHHFKPLFIGNSPTAETTSTSHFGARERSKHKDEQESMRRLKMVMDADIGPDLQELSGVEIDIDNYAGDEMTQEDYDEFIAFEKKIMSDNGKWMDKSKTITFYHLGNQIYSNDKEAYNDAVVNMYYWQEDGGSPTFVKLGRARRSHLGLDLQELNPEYEESKKWEDSFTMKKREPTSRGVGKGNGTRRGETEQMKFKKIGGRWGTKRGGESMEGEYNLVPRWDGDKLGFTRQQLIPTEGLSEREQRVEQREFSEKFDPFLHAYSGPAHATTDTYRGTKVEDFISQLLEPKAPNIEFIVENLDIFSGEVGEVLADRYGPINQVRAKDYNDLNYREEDPRIDPSLYDQDNTEFGILNLPFLPSASTDEFQTFHQSGTVRDINGHAYNVLKGDKWKKSWLDGHVIFGYKEPITQQTMDRLKGTRQKHALQMALENEGYARAYGPTNVEQYFEEEGHYPYAREHSITSIKHKMVKGRTITFYFSTKEERDEAIAPQPPMRKVIDEILDDMGLPPEEVPNLYLPPENPEDPALPVGYGTKYYGGEGEISNMMWDTAFDVPEMPYWKEGWEAGIDTTGNSQGGGMAGRKEFAESHNYMDIMVKDRIRATFKRADGKIPVKIDADGDITDFLNRFHPELLNEDGTIKKIQDRGERDRLVNEMKEMSSFYKEKEIRLLNVILRQVAEGKLTVKIEIQQRRARTPSPPPPEPDPEPAYDDY